MNEWTVMMMMMICTVFRFEYVSIVNLPLTPPFPRNIDLISHDDHKTTNPHQLKITTLTRKLHQLFHSLSLSLFLENLSLENLSLSNELPDIEEKGRGGERGEMDRVVEIDTNKWIRGVIFYQSCCNKTRANPDTHTSHTKNV